MTCQEESSESGGDPQLMDPVIDIINCDDDDDYENDPPNATEKKYFCQRCLNHGFNFPRKGHKPQCKYLNCPCEDCLMVERRRQLNNCLSKNRPRDQQKGPKVRDPQCARCAAHGLRIPLRGHKRSMCQFQSCSCTMCGMVELRRELMARQIKLRRNQQKKRGEGPTPKTKRTWKKRNQREASTTPTDTTGSPMSQEPPTLSPISSPSTPIRADEPVRVDAAAPLPLTPTVPTIVSPLLLPPFFATQSSPASLAPYTNVFGLLSAIPPPPTQFTLLPNPMLGNVETLISQILANFR